MEELRKLEGVQKVASLMQSHGVLSSSSPPPDSHSLRFLANFALFLSQPFADFDLEKKKDLILHYSPNFSASFVEEVVQQDNMKLENKHESSGAHLRDSTLENMAVIGLDAMQRANSTLDDFCRSYFMFHGMDINQPQSVFRYLPVLSFTESYIYQLDSLNEQMLQTTAAGVTALETKLQEANQDQAAEFMELCGGDPFRPLVHILKCHDLFTERISEEFKHGEEYWALERKLCHALTSKKKIFVEDVMRSIHLKSFDYRVLNLLLYRLKGEEVNDLHMEFLSISEFLVEVSDDLFDYEDDVLDNHFNVLRMFVRIYGPSAAPAVLAKHIAEAEDKYEKLLNSLDLHLSQNYQRRCVEATKEGGNTSAHPLGTWSIPPIIVDEDAYRSKLFNSECSQSGLTLGVK